VLEMAGTVGGGVRSAELTLPGFVHDVCSAIHPFGRTSLFFKDHAQELSAAGLRWVDPVAAIGHPLDDGPAVILRGSVDETADTLGDDAAAYRSLLNPLVNHWDELLPHLLAPFHIPWGPLTALRMARFGLRAITSAEGAVKRFKGERARALFAGAAAHSILPFSERFSAAAGMVMLASAHADGWPFPEGGSGNLSNALAAILEARGGEIHTGEHVKRLSDLPDHDAVIFDVSPQALAEIATDSLHGGYRRALKRYRYGPGVFKLDIAIDGRIPWKDGALQEAGTVHLGGTFDEIARSEAEIAAGRPPENPFVLLVQQSLFDRSRAPEGKNAVWAYCHVPNGSTADMTDRILSQIQRFAPGFRDTILATHVSTPADLAAYNPNYVGGDIAGGRFDLRQLFNRPARPWDPYSTPDPAIFICSASTPPGAGVHGMSGYHAAQSVLKRLSG
jgi:phytoene dehydrogenase-like protein